MNYLLDTHTFLLAAFAPAKLSAKARQTIRSADNSIGVSTISFWEVALKYGLGKIELEGCLPDELPAVAEAMRIDIISPTAQEMASFHQLPRQAHKDPFDRMLVWQAIRASRVLISRDGSLSGYRELGLRLLW